jgi:choloylglycine hydrolase
MRKLFLCGLWSLALLTFSPSAEACTGLRLTTQDGQSVHGRTLEFGVKVDTSAIIIPRGYTFTGSTPNGKGLTYQAKYAVVGAICYDNIAVMDGMNEKGLSVGTFYFPNYAGYTPTTSQNQHRSLSPIDFPNWMITQFASIDEILKEINTVAIAPTVIPVWGDAPPPFHYIIYEKSGRSIVIEPVDGKLIVHENPLGVLTNSPTFDWHMTYLSNFLNLSPNNVSPFKLNDLVLKPSLTSPKPVKIDEAVFQTFHLLNQFDIPVGVARDVRDGKVHSDYTIVTVVRDPIHLKYYFKTYEDQTIKMVDLNAFDKNAPELKIANTSGTQSYVDISNQLKLMKLNK